MGSRPGASPTPHGCLLEEQNNLQPHWNVAAELGQNPASKTLSPQLAASQRLLSWECKTSFAQIPAALATVASPVLLAWASQGWRAASNSCSLQSWHWLYHSAPWPCQSFEAQSQLPVWGRRCQGPSPTIVL